LRQIVRRGIQFDVARAAVERVLRSVNPCAGAVRRRSKLADADAASGNKTGPGAARHAGVGPRIDEAPIDSRRNEEGLASIAARSARANYGYAKSSFATAATGQEMSDEQSKLAMTLTIVTLFSSNILGGILVGYLIDKWFGTSPWMVIAGIVLGLTSAIIGMIRVLNRLNRDE
jgi:ATP synthase protein I